MVEREREGERWESQYRFPRLPRLYYSCSLVLLGLLLFLFFSSFPPPPTRRLYSVHGSPLRTEEEDYYYYYKANAGKQWIQVLQSGRRRIGISLWTDSVVMVVVTRIGAWVRFADWNLHSAERGKLLLLLGWAGRIRTISQTVTANIPSPSTVG